MDIINTDFNLNFNPIHLWQYGVADNITRLLNNESDFYKNNVGRFWENWYKNVFNIDTANRFGLEIIGKLMGVKRPTNLQALGSNINIDFNNYFLLRQYSTNRWFKIGLRSENGFQSLVIDTQSEADVVSDETFRKFLKAYMFIFNTNGSLADINRYLNMIFDGKSVSVLDNKHMSLDIFLNFEPSDDDYAIINSPNFLPLPDGVDCNIMMGSFEKVFGFNGSGLETWWDSVNEGYGADKYGTFFR